jgi:hypothetical protein
MLKTARSVIAGIIFASLGFGSFGVSLAQAQSCPDNFSAAGAAYRSWQFFPGLNPVAAIDNLVRAGRASGFWASVEADRQAGFIHAENDGAGNGRTQPVTISARRQGNGTRVDYSIIMAPGQIPGENLRLGICRFLRSATGG